MWLFINVNFLWACTFNLKLHKLQVITIFCYLYQHFSHIIKILLKSHDIYPKLLIFSFKYTYCLIAKNLSTNREVFFNYSLLWGCNWFIHTTNTSWVVFKIFSFTFKHSTVLIYHSGIIARPDSWFNKS